MHAMIHANSVVGHTTCIVFRAPTIITCAYLAQPALSITIKYGMTNAALGHCNRALSKHYIFHHSCDVQQARNYP